MSISKFFNVTAGLVILASSANATVTFGTQFGVATDSSGTPVSDGTLWALVVDNGDNKFGSTFGLDSSVNTFASTDASTLNSVFGGRSVAIGSVFAGDTVFAMGGFDSSVLSVAGSAGGAITGLDITLNGLSPGAKFAFLFFPGVKFTTQGATYNIGSQLGGVNSNTNDVAGGTDAMVIPAEGNSGLFGASTASGLGGVYSETSFRAVNLVPEPSSALLGALGVLGFLRRRRN
jgi:hypothetical protein